MSPESTGKRGLGQIRKGEMPSKELDLCGIGIQNEKKDPIVQILLTDWDGGFIVEKQIGQGPWTGCAQRLQFLISW